MKDNFSHSSDNYSKFRPGYPREAIQVILDHVSEHNQAWDCGTGNGQFAVALSPFFDKVVASDMSKNQVAHAIPGENIEYIVTPAEKTPFNDHQFDLITVAQAIHWFHFDAFYTEVQRLLKPNGIFAAIGYNLISVTNEIDTIIHHLYSEITDTYWDAERAHVDAHYQSIPFPFEEIPTPLMESTYKWSLDELIGFLNTWSGVKHYRTKTLQDPIARILPDLQQAWTNDLTKTVRFPVFMRLGKNMVWHH